MSWGRSRAAAFVGDRMAEDQHQGRDFAFQPEDDVVGAQGTMRGDSRDRAWLI